MQAGSRAAHLGAGVGRSRDAAKPKDEPETQPFISQGKARGGPWELWVAWGSCLYISNILLHRESICLWNS